MQLDIAHATATFLRKVTSASQPEALRQAHDLLMLTAERWQARQFPPLEIAAILNDWHDCLIQRTVDLAVADMQKSGFGEPPVPYCWLLLGSGGRKEQTLHPDQDNALLYAGTPGREEEERAYFQALAETAVERLAEVGYPFCPGYVMASNPRWNLSLAEWQRKVEDYATYPDWDNARYLMMLADMRPLCGDRELAAELLVWLTGALPQQAFLHYQIAHHLESQPVALDWRGRFRVDQWGEEQGRLNLKDGGYLPLVNAVRLWSMAHGLPAYSTQERIVRLRSAGVWEPAFAEEVQDALGALVSGRLWGNYVDPGSWSQEETRRMKAALKTIRLLQKRTAKRFAKPRG